MIHERLFQTTNVFIQLIYYDRKCTDCTVFNIFCYECDSCKWIVDLCTIVWYGLKKPRNVMFIKLYRIIFYFNM